MNFLSSAQTISIGLRSGEYAGILGFFSEQEFWQEREQDMERERERERERARLMERANRPRGRQELEYNRRQTSHPEYAFSYKPSSDQFGHYDRPPRPNQLWEYSRYSPERRFERRRSLASPRELNF